MDPVSNTAQHGTIDIGGILAAQNFNLAIPAGIAAALLGAVAWAAVTVVTGMQLGLMAIAVGYIVGRAIRGVGHGVGPKFAYLGAACALIGCVGGDGLSDIALYARTQHIGFTAALGNLDIGLMTKLVEAFAQPMNLLFYGIAIYEGYRFSLKYRLVRSVPAS